MKAFIVLLGICLVIVGCGKSTANSPQPGPTSGWPSDQLQQRVSYCVSYIGQMYDSQQAGQSYCQCMYNQLSQVPFSQYQQNPTQYVVGLFEQPANGYSSMDAYCAAQAGLNSSNCNYSCGWGGGSGVSISIFW